MNSGYEEKETLNSSKMGQKNSSTIYRTAGATGLLAGLAVVTLLVHLLPKDEKISDLAALWLSLAPFHILGLCAATAALAIQVQRGRLLQWLNLSPSHLQLQNCRAHIGKVLLLIYPVAALLTLITARLLASLGYDPTGSALIDMLLQKGGLPLWMSMGVIAILIAPVSEELLFRLFLFEMLKPWHRTGALLITSLAFSLVHWIPEQAPALFLLGLILQKEREHYGTLWVPILIHAGFNALSFTLLLLVRAAMR